MGTVIAGITVSVDGYFVGPDDGPTQGLGAGGERLHNWVFGGDWRFDQPVRGEPHQDDKAWLAEVGAGMGAVIGRGKSVHVMGGGDLIRQALDAGVVDELTIIVAPVILGGGKRLFEGFTRSIELDQIGVRQSRFATFIDYRIAK